MALITYIESNGEQHQIEVENGQSVMQGAVDNLIEGIVAECGGCCSCATCHCYIDEEWVEKTSAPGDMESEMLACTAEPKPTSRLSCQIQVSDELDGLVVRLPDSQF